MAYTWVSISEDNVSQYNTIKSDTTDIQNLKNNILYLQEAFHGDTNQFNIVGAAYAPSGTVTSFNVIEVVQDLNALELIQTCSSYNSTQYTSDCGHLANNSPHQAAQEASQNTNYADYSNHSSQNSNDVHCSQWNFKS